MLCKEDAAYIMKEVRRRGLDKVEKGEGSQGVGAAKQLTLADVADQPPAMRKKIVKSAIDALPVSVRELHVFDNVVQCEELAEELQYLVGKTYFDDETGVQYIVDGVGYDEPHKAVIGYRRAQDGKLHKDDDAPHLVYGDGGILQLVGLWGIDDGPDGPQWPQTDKEWAARQREDVETMALIRLCTGKESLTPVGHDKLTLLGDEKILHRLFESRGRQIWQKWVPPLLRKTCMAMHHEGAAHPGASRMLDTVKLRYYWPLMRLETSAHCGDCRGCAVRNTYLRRPKVPVQEYPQVGQPLGRVHIDLTGELPVTEGNQSKYIMVVKDFHTKFVWLFALKTKDAVAVADQLVTELYCKWGIPEMLVSDRGTEFRNKLAKRIHHIFRVNKIATTPYSPRSNGFVENHNRTMKDQLHHFVDAKQKDWDIFLPTVQLMYNTTVNAATGYTPYYLMFGRECNMPNMGGLVERRQDKLSTDEGEAAVAAGEQTVYEAWEEGLVTALELAWQYTSERAQHNAGRGNTTGRAAGLQFREYEPGDQFYRKRNRVRVFRSVQEKETHKINVKLQARYEGPYKVTRRINAVVYEVEIDGELKRVHATNMKPGTRVAVAVRGLPQVIPEDTGAAMAVS
jgi:hypothetical protein